MICYEGKQKMSSALISMICWHWSHNAPHVICYMCYWIQELMRNCSGSMSIQRSFSASKFPPSKPNKLWSVGSLLSMLPSLLFITPTISPKNCYLSCVCNIYNALWVHVHMSECVFNLPWPFKVLYLLLKYILSSM